MAPIAGAACLHVGDNRVVRSEEWIDEAAEMWNHVPCYYSVTPERCFGDLPSREPDQEPAKAAGGLPEPIEGGDHLVGRARQQCAFLYFLLEGD